MDELAKYNQARWTELVAAEVEFSRPRLDLTIESARQAVDKQGLLSDVNGQDVLCLASGGGQQSVAFGLLGANVTVFDLTPAQLERDREAAAHYDLPITTVQGDMRDLSHFEGAVFDIVWHAYSINFVPEVESVFDEAVRVLKSGGLYRVQFFNPFTQSIDDEGWTGEAYPLKQPYLDGAELTEQFPDWTVEQADGAAVRVASPREFRHALSTVINGLVARGFIICGLWEAELGDPAAEPGSWEHYKAFAPPYLTIWSRKNAAG